MDDAVLLSMAQTLGVQLRPEAARRLVPDAEYAIREVVDIAKSFMRHAKRNRLAQTDVALATNAYEAMFRRRSTYEKFVLGNSSTRYPISQPIKKLAEVYKGSLPRIQPEASLYGSWLMRKPSQNPNLDRKNETDISEGLEEKLSTENDHRTNISKENSIKKEAVNITQQELQEAVSDLISLTNTHIAPTGRPEALKFTIQALAAVLTWDSVDVEQHRDNLLRCALTCILGAYPIGTDWDTWKAREHIILALAKWKYETTDVVAVGRVTKTLLAAMLDPDTPLDALCGAIHAIIAFGEDTYRSYLTPHVPALLHSLENRLGGAIASLGEDAHTTVERICRTLAAMMEQLTPNG